MISPVHIQRSNLLVAMLIVVAGCGCVMAGAEESGVNAVRLWTAPSMQRVFFKQPVRSDAPQSCMLTSCRNEWESVQVIATGLSENIAQHTFTLSDAVNQNGVRLPEARIFWQYDVPVRRSSPHAPQAAGLFPDVLIPFSNGSKPSQLAFRNSRGVVNFRLWIDFHVPAQQPAGTYHCTLNRGVSSQVSITIQVQPETLPTTPTLKSLFGLDERRVAKNHGLHREHDGKQLMRVMSSYYDLMSDHRINPVMVFGISAPLDDDNQIVWDKPVDSNMPAPKDVVDRYFNKGSFQSLHLPMWRDYPFADPLGNDRVRAVRYLADLARLNHKAAPGAQLLFSVGSLDEPHDKEAYRSVRQWASFVHEAASLAGIDIDFFLTEQPEPQNAAWGSLYKSVDIWAPHVMWVWEDLESKTGHRKIAERIASGDEVWCYAALFQFRTRWKKEKGMPDTGRDSYPPVWLTDYPAMNYRILPWLCAVHGITGIHYWDSHHWPKVINPWSDAGSFRIGDTAFNGDGLLIYPPSPAFSKKPCASIRLKWIRDGFEDYDHLMILRKRRSQEAAGILATIARGFADWETSVSKIPAARISISKALNKTPKYQCIPNALISPNTSASPMRYPPPNNE